MIKAPFWLVLVVLMFCVGCGSSGNSAAESPTVKSVAGVPAQSGTGEVAVPTNQSPQELAAQADVLVYPGATFPDKMTQTPKKDEAGKMHTYLVMATSDAPTKVIAFYLKGGKYEEMKTKDGSQVQGLSPKGDLVLIDVTQQGGQTIISVKSVQGS